MSSILNITFLGLKQLKILMPRLPTELLVYTKNKGWTLGGLKMLHPINLPDIAPKYETADTEFLSKSELTSFFFKSVFCRKFRFCKTS